MPDRSFHLAASIGTLLVTAALVASATIRGCGSNASAAPNLVEMEAIEASLAYKKTSTKKQPVKKVRAPEPEEKPEGVSHDENKAPVEPKKDEPKRKPDENFEDQYKKFQRNDDEDLDVGKPEDQVGAFDGSEFGFAEESKGDPFFQKLLADLVAGWSYPEILAGKGVPVGCVRLAADGKVMDINFKEKSGDDALDDSVERALQNLKKNRNNDPRPIPTNLLRAATTRWTCFRFKL